MGTWRTGADCRLTALATFAVLCASQGPETWLATYDGLRSLGFANVALDAR